MSSNATFTMWYVVYKGMVTNGNEWYVDDTSSHEFAMLDQQRTIQKSIRLSKMKTQNQNLQRKINVKLLQILTDVYHNVCHHIYKMMLHQLMMEIMIMMMMMMNHGWQMYKTIAKANHKKV